jgi:hypothetical protein
MLQTCVRRWHKQQMFPWLSNHPALVKQYTRPSIREGYTQERILSGKNKRHMNEEFKIHEQNAF